MMRLTGIFRSPLYSPGRHGENDRLILEETADVLHRSGCEVDLVHESNLAAAPIASETIFSMCQGREANKRLMQLEEDGRLIINRPAAVLGCCRVLLVSAMGSAEGLFPPTAVVSANAYASPPPESGPREGPVWVKRAGAHATCREDVVRVETHAEYRNVLLDFARRGIEAAAVQRHVAGTVVKFYGVAGGAFFRCYREDDMEVHPEEIVASRSRIEALVRRIGLEVYGGDAVIGCDGRIWVIDVNDWPSFACFRTEAALAIAQHIHRRALGREEQALAIRRG